MSFKSHNNRDDEMNTVKEEPVSAETIESLKKELDETKALAKEYLDGWQRGQADFVNFKKRLEQDKIDYIKFANADLMLKILPVLDDFERAAEHMPAKMASDPWVDGVSGIARKLETTLEGLGLSRINAQGEVFDPCVHEAVGNVSGPDGQVIKELQKGYKLNERVLRPSKVMVGNGAEE
ncbi:MAG: nucleotide exchange factor GrpE [Dehalococcoidia bacterium]|nr:nucleotide exchange factor GrpE [Dehalococcoidia bacterium]